MVAPVLAVACGGSTAAPADAGSCTPGDSERCACGADDGIKRCLASATWSACVCDSGAGADRCGAAGSVRSCACDDGSPGERVCLADGTSSDCACAQPAGEVEVAEPAGEAASPGAAAATARCCRERGTCLPQTALAAADRAQLARDSCSDVELVCVPDVLAARATTSLPPCRSLGEVEGRCLPDCLPELGGEAALLPRSSCAKHELCVPCFDPQSGEDSGVCTLTAGDAPEEPKVLFGRCCGGQGSCVPATLVPEDTSALLPRDVCDEGRGLLCVPDTLAASASVPLASCTALGLAEGRCLPACLPALAGGGDWLDQASCPPAERCVPCTDPLTAEPTSACAIGADPGPAGPPFVFGFCCDVAGESVGRCLPRSRLPASAASLPALECTGQDEACVPATLLDDPTSGFATCSTRFGSDGACVPECMVDPDLAPLLTRESCETTALCVPCVILGQPTGACQGP